MENDINMYQEPVRKTASFITEQSNQIFELSQVIEDGNGGEHEMKIGSLSTGDVGLISGDTIYGKFVIRHPKTAPT